MVLKVTAPASAPKYLVYYDYDQISAEYADEYSTYKSDDNISKNRCFAVVESEEEAEALVRKLASKMKDIMAKSLFCSEPD